MATWFVYFFLNCSWQTIFFSRKLSIYSNFLMYWYKVYNLVISAVSVVISLLYIMLVAQSCPTLRPHGLSMEFSRQEYWSGLPFPSPGDHPNPGIEPGFPALQADSLLSELLGKPFCTLFYWSFERSSFVLWPILCFCCLFLQFLLFIIFHFLWVYTYCILKFFDTLLINFLYFFLLNITNGLPWWLRG